MARTETNPEILIVRRTLFWGFVVILVSIIGYWVIGTTKSGIEKQVYSYEEFHSLYTACQQVNTDLGTIRAVPDDDPMFRDFSKQAIVAQKRQRLSGLVNEYNAKSSMVTRNLLKSGDVPERLSVNDFSNYNSIQP